MTRSNKRIVAGELSQLPNEEFNWTWDPFTSKFPYQCHSFFYRRTKDYKKLPLF